MADDSSLLWPACVVLYSVHVFVVFQRFQVRDHLCGLTKFFGQSLFE